MRRRPAPRNVESNMIGRRKSQTNRLNAACAGFVTVCVASALTAACQRETKDNAAPASGLPAAALESGYAAPPEVNLAQRTANGVTLSGKSDPGARVRLFSPDGNAYGATTNGSGDWSLTVPTLSDMREFGLSEVIGARDVQGASYFAVLPAPGRPAVLLRAGGGSQALAVPTTVPQVTTIDFDAGGGAVVSGLGKPGAPVRLTIDGGPPVEVRPDRRGGFSVILSGVLKPGEHEAVVQSGDGSGAAQFSVAATAPVTGLPYRGQRRASDWRIDWITPGGGAQTTLVIDPPGGSS